MPKLKSRFIGLVLAIFTGPLSFTYVRKWKKALLLIALLLIPFVNIIVYLYCLFAIVSDVKQHNRDVQGIARFGFVVCRCQNYNRPGFKFCSSCGTKLVKACNECGHLINKNEKYCNHCGYAFKRFGKHKFALRKLISLA